MEHHCFSRLGNPCSSSHSLFMAHRTKLIWLIRQWPFLARLALWTSSFPIPNRRSLRRRVRGRPHCLSLLRHDLRNGFALVWHSVHCSPVVQSHAAAQPLIEVSDIAKRNSNHVVVHCSTKVGFQIGNDFHGRVTSRSFGQSPHFGFELLLALLRPTDFPVDDGEAEEARFLK